MTFRTDPAPVDTPQPKAGARSRGRSRSRITAELAAGDAELDQNQRFLVAARYLQIHRQPAEADTARRLAAKLGYADLGPGLGPAA